MDLGGSGDEIRTLTSLAEFWVTYLSFGCFSNTQPEEQKSPKIMKSDCSSKLKALLLKPTRKLSHFHKKPPRLPVNRT